MIHDETLAGSRSRADTDATGTTQSSTVGVDVEHERPFVSGNLQRKPSIDVNVQLDFMKAFDKIKFY